MNRDLRADLADRWHNPPDDNGRFDRVIAWIAAVTMGVLSAGAALALTGWWGANL